jgi:predicted nucleic acid-binding protein
MKRIDFGKTRKIRSISIDSDIIIDIPALKILQSKYNLSKEEKKYLERCEVSLQTLSLVFASKVNVLGTEIVKKELAYSPVLRSLYDRVFDKEVPLSSEAKRLAIMYMKKRKIKPADSFILASISVGKIDCFLSWNREHIVNPEVNKLVREINKDRNLPMPLIITPSDFLQRIVLSPERTICFFRDPIPQKFHLHFYPSKQLL